MNSVIGRYRMIAACTYSLHMCGAAEVIDVVQNHQFSLINRQGRWTLIEGAERRRASEELQSLNRQLEQRTLELESTVQELQSFSYSVSHDLRAPLRAIDGYSKMLIQGYGDKLDEEGRRLLAVVRDSTSKMSRSIDDILTFSRLGRVDLRQARRGEERQRQRRVAHIARVDQHVACGTFQQHVVRGQPVADEHVQLRREKVGDHRRRRIVGPAADDA